MKPAPKVAETAEEAPAPKKVGAKRTTKKIEPALEKEVE